MNIIPANQDLQPLIVAIATGADKQMEQQLFSKSREPNILKYTPNDAAKRFSDQATFDKWIAAGREIHWLLGKDNDLAGILWYGKKDFPLERANLTEIPGETLAIRLYNGYTGHGLARPAMKQSLAVHVKAKQEQNEPLVGIWLQTDVDNAAAVATYTKFGYHEVFHDETRVTMVLAKDEILKKCSGEL